MERSRFSCHGNLPGIAARMLTALFALLLPAPARAADLLVSSEGTNQVLRYDGQTGAFVGVFASGNGLFMPEGLAFGADGNLYVASFSSNRVLRFHGTTGAFIDEFVPSASNIMQPVGIVFRAGTLYVGERTSASIKRYDAMSGAAIGMFASGGLSMPDAFVFGPDGDIYVSSRGSHVVLRFDGTTGAAKGTFASGGGLSTPEVPLFGDDGNLYVASRGSNAILRYNGATGTFIDVFASAGLTSPFGLCRGADQRLYVTSLTTASVKRYDGVSGALVGTFVASGSGGLSTPTFLTFMPGPLGDACAQASQCGSGFCVDGVCCDTACGAGPCDACSVAAGAAINGTCALLSDVACNDGSFCTQTDTCQTGVCFGNPIVCAALDPCHGAGSCDPASGLCSNPAKPDGTVCNDGNDCTQADLCEFGVCTGTNPMDCAPIDACHDAGTCDPVTGACTTPSKQDGSPCADGTECTTNDTCQGGVCVGATPVVCLPLDACHEDGACDPATGMCSYAQKADGSACDDGNVCTQNDQCNGGVCVGNNSVVCPGDDCHDEVTCDPVTGMCSGLPKADGTPCPDGTCSGGECISSTSSGSGGMGGAGGSGASGGTTGGGTNSSGGDGDNSTASGGCGCGVVGSRPEDALWVQIGFTLLFLARRRRGKR